MVAKPPKPKACRVCGEIKPVSEFHRRSDSRDGLKGDCKACAKISATKWRAANPEKVKAGVAKWQAANPEKVKAIDAKWRAENPEKVKAALAKWAALNQEALRIIWQNRRSRKRANGGRLSSGLAERLFKLQKGKCACCGKPLGDNYHLDHIMPLALGGSNADDNIQLLCQTCNLSKGAKHPVEFMQKRGFLL